VKATGPAADANPFRFSTKYAEQPASGPELYYYGRRYYNPGLGRWVSRDPIDEAGGAGLYSFTGNSAANVTDPLGMAIWPWLPWLYDPDPEDGIGPGTRPGDICRKKEERKATGCEHRPCTPVAGTRFGQHTHDSHDHFMKRLGSYCKPLTGSVTHWHYLEVHQGPAPDCRCSTVKKDGGCGGAPAVVPPDP